MLTLLAIPLMLLCPIAADNSHTAMEPKVLPAVPIHLSTEHWLGFTEQDHTGAYFELVQLIFPPPHYPLHVTFTNYNRALTLVRQRKADMTLAVSKHNNDDLLLSAKPIDLDIIVAVYHPESTVLEQLDELKSLRLAWNLAYDFGNILSLDSTGYEVQSTQQGVELVLNQRIDVYLAEQSQIEQYEQRGKISLWPLTSIVIATDDIYAAFANNENGKLLKCLWDQRFELALANGQLHQLYQRHANFHLPTD